jgi:hypothetical protein
MNSAGDDVQLSFESADFDRRVPSAVPGSRKASLESGDRRMDCRCSCARDVLTAAGGPRCPGCPGTREELTRRPLRRGR